jgi:predicted ribosomally synthesized peptide with SipW-like signal peptide
MLALAIGWGTYAYFSDTEKSSGNVFTAGTLDLQIDGGDTNVIKFTVNNFRPGNQPIGTYALKNAGSIDGYLDLFGINVTDNENGRTEPEIEAGDTTDDVGELSSLIGLTMFIDQDGNGWYGTGDVYIFNGIMHDIASGYNLNLPIPAGSTKYITIQINWWSTANDNLAQSDSVVLDIGFRLDQTA